jgi:hypothetical protein
LGGKRLTGDSYGNEKPERDESAPVFFAAGNVSIPPSCGRAHRGVAFREALRSRATLQKAAMKVYSIDRRKGGPMVRFVGIAVVFASTLFGGTQTVSLTGTVTKTGGTVGLAGVKVGLAKAKNLYAITLSSGSFNIYGSVAARFGPLQNVTPFQIMLQKKTKTIVFSTAFPNTTGSIDIFSSDGKTMTRVRFHAPNAGKQTVALPALFTGLNILRITIGSESFTVALVSMGEDLILKNETESRNSRGGFIVTKNAAVVSVDTLVSEKEGYLTKKTAITGYSQKEIAITLDTCENNCQFVFIDSAFFFANNGYGRVDSVGIYLKRKLALIPDSIIVFWPFRLDSLKRSVRGVDPAMRLSSDSTRITLILASQPFPAGMTAARSADRLGITYNRPNNNPGTQESALSFNITDKVGPLLMDAQVAERITSGPGIDTLYVSFSEAIQRTSVNGNALQLFQNGVPTEFTILSAEAQQGGNNWFKLTVTSAVKLQFGDSLRINPYGSITDSLGNYAHPLNRPILIRIIASKIPPAIETAYYFDDEGGRADGVVDSAVLKFNRKASISDMDISIEWAGSGGSNKAEHLSQNLLWYRDADSSSIKAFVRGQFAGLSETTVKTSGAMRVIVKFNSLGQSVIANVLDSTAPVLVDTAIYRPGIRPAGQPAVPDTLYVSFSEPVTSILWSMNSPFRAENMRVGLYGLNIVIPSVLVPDWTNNVDRFRYKFIVSSVNGVTAAETGDSLWIDPLATVKDASGVAQDNPNNRKIFLHVFPAPR